MMLVTFMVLPFLAARPVLAQDTLKLDLGKALEIALSAVSYTHLHFASDSSYRWRK